MSEVCKNCGQTATGNYCPDCGQTMHTGRIDLHHIIHDFLHGVLHVDKGILFTIKELTLRPGQTIRNYLEGKRAKYFKPFAYVFILATIYTVIMHFIGVPIIDANDFQISSRPILDSPIMLTMNEIIRSLFSIVNDHTAISTLLLLPLYALGSFLIYRKEKYNYGEHLVINSYIHGHAMLLQILSIPVSYYVSNLKVLMLVTPLSLLLIGYMYFNVFNKYKMIPRISLPFLAYFLGYIFSIFVLGGIFSGIIIFKLNL
ncbi:DUF3667 domain-containing protein [Dysgonomonas sp. 25]|uniref:DUF3667 domain-containing protein n=1 Tax=Dysgonomonas sp. 25 TaxID=2302933 RepID=UPI0013D5BC1A|nr:DUF3667 domain-containing protein [Dysgonomonas sp. 25]NDV70095.1 DUF3667 domain-containing protein [Dysgonomonas sp. 25]